jgi:hypothetical protein
MAERLGNLRRNGPARLADGPAREYAARRVHPVRPGAFYDRCMHRKSRAAHRASATLAAALVLFAAAPGAWAGDDSMRCGSRLVRQGDAKDKVRALCGEPTDVSLRGYLRRAPRYDYGFGYHGYEYYGPGFIDLPVEIWTYNFGSSKLLRKLRFVGDELEEIETAGHGY